MTTQVFARATAQIVVEYPLKNTWGTGCELSQVYGQAMQEAKSAARDLVAKGACVTEIKIVRVHLEERK